MEHTVVEKQREPILDLVEKALSIPSAGPDWLSEIRKKSMNRVLDSGLPTARQEPWRFTNLKPIKEIAFEKDDCHPKIDTATLDGLPFTNLECPKLVFVNGYLAGNLSQIQNLPKGLRVVPLSSAIDQDDPVLRKHFGQYVDQNQIFANLNTALFSDGAFIEVEAGAVVEQPIQLLFVTVSRGKKPALSAPRNLIVAGEHSQASFIEVHVGAGKDSYLTIPVTEIAAGENAVIDHYKIQQEASTGYHIGNFTGSESANTRLSTINIALAGAIIRNDTRVNLEGENGWAELDGLFLNNDDHHVDNYTTIHHAQPHCDSREHYRGILADRSKGVFRGRIIVAEGAQKTDSKQTNNNLLLSDDASINTKPQLEIYADDVKCTHGATVGQLDQEAIFYLRVRGISKQVAHSMLVYAFAGQIVNRIKNEILKRELKDYLFTRLPHGDFLRAAGEI